MARQLNSRQGFTLIELMIVVAIIGIIAVLLIPNFLDAIQKAKQKRTVSDQKVIGTAMMNWLAEQASAAAAGMPAALDVADYTGTRDIDLIRSELTPMAIQDIPERDAWKKDYLLILDIADPNREQVMLVGSGGRDNSDVDGTYNYGSFNPTDFDQDIIWADGFFVHWPEGAR